MTLSVVTSLRAEVETHFPSRKTVMRSAISNTSSKSMADKQDRYSLLAQPAHQLEQLSYFMHREGGRRLVHDQNAHIQGYRLRDFDRLLCRQGQSPGWLAARQA